MSRRGQTARVVEFCVEFEDLVGSFLHGTLRDREAGDTLDERDAAMIGRLHVELSKLREDAKQIASDAND